MKQHERNILSCCFISLLSSCYIGRDIIWNVADIHDYKQFASVNIEKSSTPFHFIETPNAKLPLTPASDSSMLRAFKKSKTVAFLVIRNDSILYQYYSPDYSENSIVPSFSMAKSFISLLIGIAIDEGYIKSVRDPITNYLTELDQKKFGGITIADLLDMRSGIRFDDNELNPFGGVAKFYYGLNLKKLMTKLRIKEKADQHYEYVSANTELLGWIIEKATGQPVEEYFHKKVWEPLGMEYDASWSVDSKRNKMVKAFCCLNARAKDFAKLGRLYLNNGNWDGKQIVSAQWVKFTTTPEEKNNFDYSYGWWHNVFLQEKDSLKMPKNWDYDKLSKEQKNNLIKVPMGDFYAYGLLGQFIYVNAFKKTVIVRLGKKEGDVGWPLAFYTIAKH